MATTPLSHNLQDEEDRPLAEVLEALAQERPGSWIIAHRTEDAK